LTDTETVATTHSIQLDRENPAHTEVELLALAASDMKQCAAAARLLVKRSDVNERRSLETAIAISYARAFSKRSFGKLDDKTRRPHDDVGQRLHKRLIKMRNRVYAHLDQDRSGLVTIALDDDSFIRSVGVGEQWKPIARPDLPLIVEMCEEQAGRFAEAAASRAVALLPAIIGDAPS
jgi:hypothetical protein